MQVAIARYVDMPNLPQAIREHRKKSELSNTQLAAIAGISVVHWHRIETGKIKTIPIEVLRGIEKALDTDFGIETESSVEGSK